MATSLSDYRALPGYPGARAPMVASAIGRFPIAMVGLAELLYLQRATGSFAAAGAVAAAGVAGVSVGSVLQGRLIDRLGPTRPLLVATTAFALLITTLVTAVERGAPLPLLIGIALVAGLSQPALFGASRSLWTVLVPAGSHREAALTYEAVSLEVFFILGPAAAALLIAAPWPGTGVVVAAASLVVGNVWFALTRAVRRQPPIASARDTTAPGLGALGTPGMRTVTLASLGFGLVVGVVEVGVPATTTAAGNPALAGVLLSGWSVASVLFGLLYALRPWPRPLHLRAPALLAGFGGSVMLMAPGGALAGVVGVAVAMMLAGCLLTPQVTLHSLAVELSAPAGTTTEAFGWVITAATLGIAAGQGTAGVVAELAGPGGAFLVGGGAGLLVAGVLWLRRESLRVAAAPEEAHAPARP
jgi:MFS family permease